MRLTRTVPSSSRTETEVSSQEVSMPRIMMRLRGLAVAKSRGGFATRRRDPATSRPHLIIRRFMSEELPKQYEPAAIEQRLYAFWEAGEFFTPLLDGERPKFSIVIPPPNVTGRLHIGHAL